MSAIPDDLMKAAEKAFKYGFGLRYAVAIEAIAKEIYAERQRCADTANEPENIKDAIMDPYWQRRL